ncbi:MAG: rhomboid family intramembrane serine protease [Bacteroidetes bacterium]|nr:rhomboid family intramembrane serine protease [Bacteroidota bacterium]
MPYSFNLLRHRLWFPIFFLFLLWVIMIIDLHFHLELPQYGLYPLQKKGLIGILTMPLLHANLSHLMANSIPVLVLSAALFFFYEKIAWPVFFWIYLLSGLWTWFLARSDAPHVGASGLIYGLAAFLFTSGVIRRDNRLAALSLLVAFLYGGLLWGVFPQFFPMERISWEGHLMGLVAGFVIALFYKNQGPQRKQYEWEEEENEENEENEVNEVNEDKFQ